MVVYDWIQAVDNAVQAYNTFAAVSENSSSAQNNIVGQGTVHAPHSRRLHQIYDNVSKKAAEAAAAMALGTLTKAAQDALQKQASQIASEWSNALSADQRSSILPNINGNIQQAASELQALATIKKIYDWAKGYVQQNDTIPAPTAEAPALEASTSAPPMSPAAPAVEGASSPVSGQTGLEIPPVQVDPPVSESDQFVRDMAQIFGKWDGQNSNFKVSRRLQAAGRPNNWQAEMSKMTDSVLKSIQSLRDQRRQVSTEAAKRIRNRATTLRQEMQQKIKEIPGLGRKLMDVSLSGDSVVVSPNASARVALPRYIFLPGEPNTTRSFFFNPSNGQLSGTDISGQMIVLPLDQENMHQLQALLKRLLTELMQGLSDIVLTPVYIPDDISKFDMTPAMEQLGMDKAQDPYHYTYDYYDYAPSSPSSSATQAKSFLPEVKTRVQNRLFKYREFTHQTSKRRRLASDVSRVKSAVELQDEQYEYDPLGVLVGDPYAWMSQGKYEGDFVFVPFDPMEMTVPPEPLDDGVVLSLAITMNSPEEAGGLPVDMINLLANQSQQIQSMLQDMALRMASEVSSNSFGAQAALPATLPVLGDMSFMVPNKEMVSTRNTAKGPNLQATKSEENLADLIMTKLQGAVIAPSSHTQKEQSATPDPLGQNPSWWGVVFGLAAVMILFAIAAISAFQRHQGPIIFAEDRVSAANSRPKQSIEQFVHGGQTEREPMLKTPNNTQRKLSKLPA